MRAFPAVIHASDSGGGSVTASSAYSNGPIRDIAVLTSQYNPATGAFTYAPPHANTPGVILEMENGEHVFLGNYNPINIGSTAHTDAVESDLNGTYDRSVASMPKSTIQGATVTQTSTGCSYTQSDMLLEYKLAADLLLSLSLLNKVVDVKGNNLRLYTASGFLDIGVDEKGSHVWIGANYGPKANPNAPPDVKIALGNDMKGGTDLIRVQMNDGEGNMLDLISIDALQNMTINCNSLKINANTMDVKVKNEARVGASTIQTSGSSSLISTISDEGTVLHKKLNALGCDDGVMLP